MIDGQRREIVLSFVENGEDFDDITLVDRNNLGADVLGRFFEFLAEELLSGNAKKVHAS